MLSLRISFLRKKYHMSQSEVAMILNISASTLGMYEQGRRVPPLDILIKLSHLFDVSLDFLITGHEYTGGLTEDADQMADNCPCKTCFWKEYRRK